MLRFLYRLLLLAYPRTFRVEHADEAARVFADACRESWRERGFRGVVARLWRALIDVPARGLAERAVFQRSHVKRRRFALVSDIWQDARYGVRSLHRSPAFALTALLVMTMGITLNTAMFTAFNAVGLQRWPVENADRLLVVRSENLRAGVGLDWFESFGRSQTLSVVAGHRRAFQAVSLEPGGRGRGSGFGAYVTREFFTATGVRLTLGRDFSAGENRLNSHAPVVIISHNLWQELFHRSSDAIGRTVFIGKRPYSVIGVAREGWRGEQPFREDFWLPLNALREAWPDDSLFSGAAGRCCLDLLGLQSAGYSRAQVTEELTLLAQLGQTDRPLSVFVSDTSMYRRLPASFQAGIVLAVAVATGLILLLTGANLAHLQLARAIARAREIRTRMAVGASRGRVLRQLITEAFLLTVIAGALAMALVYALLDTLMRISEMPMREVWAPNLTVYAYCIAVSFAMSITFSLLPALRSTRVNLAQAGTASTGRRLRFNLVLLTVQIALSTTLLTGAGLLTRALVQATRGDAGFAIEGLTVAGYVPGGPAQTRDTARAFRLSLVQALTQPDLPPAAFVDVLPFSDFSSALVLRDPADKQSAVSLDLAPMSPAAFAVFGIPLVDGRLYAAGGADSEAVVNEVAARRLWPGESPIGKTLFHAKRAYTIVGISKDVNFFSREHIRPMLHVAEGVLTHHPRIVVRGGGPAVADRLNAIVSGLDPRATVNVRSLSAMIASRLGDERAGAQAAWAGGLMALALATFGVFGVFAFVVEERRREIGIRVALGAERREVLTTMFRPARVSVSTGLALGLILSLSVGPALQAMGIRLFGLNPFDPVTFAVVAAILAAAAVAATFIPARRALAVDPAVILKEDA